MLQVCALMPRHARELLTPSAVPTLGKYSRATYGLPAGGTLYICPQNTAKLHPALDRAFARVLLGDAAGVLVLLGAHRAPQQPGPDPLAVMLAERMGEAAQVPPAQLLPRIVVVPRQRGSEYMGA